MSFKLFILQTFGKLKPIEKIETERQALWNDFQEFNIVEKSEELKEFLELDQWIKSDSFKKKKAEIEAIRFKGSIESNQLDEFLKLSKTGGIKNYFAVEKSEPLKRFENLKNSKKLADFYELEDYIKNGSYQKEKAEIQKQVFKGSVEEKHLNEFKKLQKLKSLKAFFELEGSAELKAHQTFTSSEKLKRYQTLKNAPDNGNNEKKELKVLKGDAEIKKYFRFEKSVKLKYYHEVKGSHNLARFNELKTLTGSDEFKKQKAFLEDKTKFEKSEAFKKFNQFKQLSNDGDIKFFLGFEKSKSYKNYLDVKDSLNLKRYFELKELTGSKEFIERKAYLENKKKWEKSEEFLKEQKYLEMKKLPHLVRYFKYKGGNDFDFFRTWDVFFEDQFESGKINEAKWSTLGYWAKKLVGENFSQPGDLQYFSSGNNINTGKKGLAIQVRKEKAKGKFWNPAAGFTPAEFQFTSGQLCADDNFLFKEGIIEAKIKFNPVKEIVSFFYLHGETASPQLNILEMGAKNRFGLMATKDGKLNFSGESISNLRTGKFYLFALEKTSKLITWKINGQVIYELPSGELDFPMHMNLASIVVNEVPASKLPADFEVAWIKCYKNKD
jgi:hypothetical protein